MKDRQNGTCPWLILKRRQVLFKDVAVASFGVFVICPRPGNTGSSVRCGELCINLGPELDSPGAHHVYSTETSLVLLHRDFNVALNYDGITKFKVNKYHVPPPVYAQNVRQFNRDITRQTDISNLDTEV